MKFQKIDKALAADLSGNDMIIVYDAGSEIYFMGSIMTNHSMSLDEALNLIGWDEETMDEMTAALGWDGWNYEDITYTYKPAEYLTERGLLPKTKHWCFIEDCTSSKSEIYDEILKASTATKAFVEAAGRWDALTETDRNRRDEAYIGFADTDEDGCVDYDTMTGIYYLRREKKTVYYLLDDQNGYGSEYPVCTDAVETARLLEGWAYSGTDDPLPDRWREANRAEIEELGTYDGTTGTIHPGTRETEDEEA